MKRTMNKQHPILSFVLLTLLVTAPFTNAQSQQPSEKQLAQILKRFPEADKDKDGKLSTEEVQQFVKSRQRKGAQPRPHNRRRPGMRNLLRRERYLLKGEAGRTRKPRSNSLSVWKGTPRREVSSSIRKPSKRAFRKWMPTRMESLPEKRRARSKGAPKVEKAPMVEKAPTTKKATVGPIFNTEEILDESTLETKTLQDWHPVGDTRQKVIEINVADWWPGQDYRIPVRMIVPLKGKAKGFSITGANAYEGLMKDTAPSEFESKLLAGGVGIVKTHVKAFRHIPGKKGLEQKMMREFMKDRNPRYTIVWIWSMTLMRATTAAYAETDHFEKGKVAGSGSSKNGISPAVALINDERFTATCSNHAFAYSSPTRRKTVKRQQKRQRQTEHSLRPSRLALSIWIRNERDCFNA